MKRPVPTIELILAMTGSKRTLVSTTHHGLYEVPLSDLYTDLNLGEIIAFAAGSWKIRKGGINSFAEFVKSATTYEIFTHVYKIGFPWLNGNKHIPEELRELYEQLNPYRGRNLEARLDRVKPEAVQTLKEKLQGPVGKYPSKKADEYAAEVAEMISMYLREYEPLTAVKPPFSRQQLSLPL